NAGRRNLDMLYVIHDNGVYGLTKGQAAPTLKLGVQTKSLAHPNINDAVNPIWLALAAGATWVGRGHSYDIKHLVSLLMQGIEHRSGCSSRANTSPRSRNESCSASTRTWTTRRPCRRSRARTANRGRI